MVTAPKDRRSSLQRASRCWATCCGYRVVAITQRATCPRVVVRVYCTPVSPARSSMVNAEVASIAGQPARRSVVMSPAEPAASGAGAPGGSGWLGVPRRQRSPPVVVAARPGQTDGGSAVRMHLRVVAGQLHDAGGTSRRRAASGSKLRHSIAPKASWRRAVIDSCAIRTNNEGR